MRSLLLLLLIFSFSSRVTGQCILRVSGVVKDADTRTVLQGATVTITELKLTVQTDSSGNYVFSGVCPGDYTLRITHADCQAMAFHFHLKEDYIQNAQLSHTENVLKEVVVVGAAGVRNEGMTGELRGRDLASTRGLSLGESLQRITGVSVLQTGNNIYKPVIQGLHSSRVLILNNGIRQEGQQWGSEHAPEIDPYVANRITVIKGASSVRYGGDAIGGVVLVEPRLLQYNPELNGELNLAAFSNNRQGVLSAMFEGGLNKSGQNAWRLQGTVKRGGNARTPAYWLENSGVEEFNMSAAAGWKKKDKGLELFYSLFNTRLGIFTGSHIGNLTDLENIIRNGEPPVYIRDAAFSYQLDRPYQAVQHQLFKVRAFAEEAGKSRLSLTLSTQYNIRKEFDITRTERDNPQLELNLFTTMADLVWEHFSHKKIRGSMGFNAMYQRNDINYRYFVPNYSSLDMGIWAAERLQLDKWQFEMGLRYDYRNRYGITDNDKVPFDRLMGNALVSGEPYGNRIFSGLSGTGVAALQVNSYLRASMTFASAWRSPQVNELFSNGLHHGAARIEKGDPAIRTERAYSVLANLVFNKEKWDVEAGIYNKEISNFIYLKPVYPALLTIRGAFPAFLYAQTDAALSGADVSVGYAVNRHLKTKVKSSLLRAYDKSAKTWLIQMPADRYETEIEYLFVDGKKLKNQSLRASFQHITQQKRVPPTGNIKVKDASGVEVMQSDYMMPPPAYSLVNLEYFTSLEILATRIECILGVNNLLNTSYRDYMNAFRYFALDRGRNLSIKVKILL